MSYYIHLENDKIISCGEVPMSDPFHNIEVNEQVYTTFIRDRLKYIWNGTEIIENPNYETDKLHELNKQRNIEIDSKIKELQEMCLPELLNGNKSNIDLYLDVISGLEAARPNN